MVRKNRTNFCHYYLLETFQKHLTAEHEKKAQKVKTPAAQEKKRKEGAEHVAHVEKNKQHYDNLLKMHHHLIKILIILT